MTSITVNNNPIRNELNKNSTLRDVMNLVLEDFAGGNDIITNIKIDGKQIDLHEDSSVYPVNIGQFSEINFTLQSSIELAYEALDSCSAYIDLVSAKIMTLVKLFAKNQHQEANIVFSEIIEIMDLFVQLMTKIHGVLRPKNDANSNLAKLIQGLEIHLLSILKALIPAKEKEDIIMLSDLLEYELVDNLTQWKIKAIPGLKKLKDN